MDEFSVVLLRSIHRPLSLGVLAIVGGGILQSVCLSTLAQVSFIQVCCQGNELLQVECEACALTQYRHFGVLGEVCAAAGGMMTFGVMLLKYGFRRWRFSRAASPPDNALRESEEKDLHNVPEEGALGYASLEPAAFDHPLPPPPPKLPVSHSRRRVAIFLWVVSGTMAALSPVVYWMSLKGCTSIELAPYSIHFAGGLSLIWYLGRRGYHKARPSLLFRRRAVSFWRGPKWAPFAPAASILLFLIFAVLQPLGKFGFFAPVSNKLVDLPTAPKVYSWWGTIFTLVNVLQWWTSHLALYKQPHLMWLLAGWCAFVTCITCGALLSSLGLQDTRYLSLKAVFVAFDSLQWILLAQGASGFLLFAGIAIVSACGGPVLCAASKATGFAVGSLFFAIFEGTSVVTAPLCLRLAAFFVVMIPVVFPKHFASLSTAHHLRLRHAPQLLLLEEGITQMLDPSAAAVRLSPSPLRRYVSRAQVAFGQAINDAVISPIQSTQNHLQFSSQRSLHSDRQNSRERRYYSHPGNSFVTDNSDLPFWRPSSRSSIPFPPHALSFNTDIRRSRTMQDFPLVGHVENHNTPQAAPPVDNRTASPAYDNRRHPVSSHTQPPDI